MMQAEAKRHCRTVFDQPQSAQADEELPLIDYRVMNDWCADLGKADVAELLARVPGESHKCLSGIKEAVGRGDLAAAKRMAHRLKGMASNLGAARLARMARSIELVSNDIADASARSVALEATLIATLEALQSHC
jgi:HPt (histidine-containing phosphotransfer) domain-containing protein